MNRAKRPAQAVAVILLLFTLVAGAVIPPAAGPEANVQSSSPSIMDEIGELSSHVVSGKVSAVNSYMNDRGSISTKITVAVDSVLKGTSVPEKIVVEHEGGQIGDTAIHVFWEKPLGNRIVGTRSPSFAEGDTVTLYLLQDGDVFYPPYDDLGVVKADQSGQSTMDASSGGEGYVFSYYYWSSLPVGYYINQDVTSDCTGEFGAVQWAFETWEKDVGSYMDFEFSGLTSAGFNPFDGINVVNWSNNLDFIPTHPLAMVEIRSWGFQIVEADMVFNDRYNWSAEQQTPPYTYDVQQIATHEAGHYLQLLDLGDASDKFQTMYSTSRESENLKRSLYWGDIAGIRRIYPHTYLAGAGLGWESQGGDLALGDINGNGTQDMVLARVNNGQGNYIFYWVGYDISGATGQVASWSDLRWYPNWIGEDSAGLGAALTNIDADPRLDLVLVWVNVIPSGPDNGYYSVGMNLNADGWPTHWTPVTWGFQVSWETQGAGVAMANLNGGPQDPSNDMVVNWADNTSSDNHIRYRVFWDMDASGQVTGMSDEFTMPDSIGTQTQGVGITILNLDADSGRLPEDPPGSTTLDYVMMWIDNPSGENYILYRVGWDASGDGVPDSWSRQFDAGGWVGSSSQGGGISAANLDLDGRPDLTVMWVDNPPSEDYLYYRQV